MLCLLFGGAAALGLGTALQQPFQLGLLFAGKGPGLPQADEDLSTGSVIFVPILGNMCRKKVIDNATWRIRDIGPVECRTALGQGGNQSGWSTSRVDIIRNGFYSR